MCLIIDANCATEALCATPSEDFKPVMDAILKKNAMMVKGGTKQLEEYKRLPVVWRFIVNLDRAGRTKTCSTSEVDSAEFLLKKSGSLQSDDPHIIALAQISGARLLCSKDHNLHTDFLSKSLIDKPRGSVYQNKAHAPLVKKCCKG